jgi:hypothetical protein
LVVVSLKLLPLPTWLYPRLNDASPESGATWHHADADTSKHAIGRTALSVRELRIIDRMGVSCSFLLPCFLGNFRGLWGHSTAHSQQTTAQLPGSKEFNTTHPKPFHRSTPMSERIAPRRAFVLARDWTNPTSPSIQRMHPVPDPFADFCESVGSHEPKPINRVLSPVAL